MAKVLIVYYSDPKWGLLPANESHLSSLRRFSKHRCFYLNTSRVSVPEYLAKLDPDLVIFHYTFLVYRRTEDWDRILQLLDFIRHTSARKVMLPSDESWCCDKLVEFIRDFDVSQVLSFGPPQSLPIIYEGVDPEKVAFHSVLSSYIDDRAVRRVTQLARRTTRRTIDIGARMTGPGSNMGHQGEYRGKICDAFAAQAPRHGLTTDISREYVLHDSWLRFLLSCRYQLGTETGSSLLDRDGSILSYFESDKDASLQALEAMRPGIDGTVDYRAMAPRHLDAVIAGCCQALVAGDYSGVLRPGEHYLEVNRDFSNVDDVIELMKDEELRLKMAARAYRDIVESGQYSYRVFADRVFALTLAGLDYRVTHSGWLDPAALAWNRVDDALPAVYVKLSGWRSRARNFVLETLRPGVSKLFGEERLRRALRRLRGK